jgi:large subunit ribosomal protein L25
VPMHFINADKSPGVKEQGGVVSHILNELDIVCFPADLPEFVEVDLAGLAVGNSVHARQLALPKGVELALNKNEDPVVATVVVPQLVTEDETVAAEAAVVSAAEVPTTAQAAPAKDGEAAADGDKGGAKGGDKAAAKPAADKGDKKDKK